MPTPRVNGGFEMPADGWFHVVAVGEFPHEAGVVQVIDTQAAEAIVANFKELAAAPRFPGLLVDFDHFSMSGDTPSTAAGWVTDLEIRPNGVWARIRWSDQGQAAVDGGRYRLVSPQFSAAAEDIDRLGKNRVRVNRLLSVGLTNAPNIQGMAPLSNMRRAAPAATLCNTAQQPTAQPARVAVEVTPQRGERQMMASALLMTMANRRLRRGSSGDFDAALQVTRSKNPSLVRLAQQGESSADAIDQEELGMLANYYRPDVEALVRYLPSVGAARVAGVPSDRDPTHLVPAVAARLVNRLQRGMSAEAALSELKNADPVAYGAYCFLAGSNIAK